MPTRKGKIVFYRVESGADSRVVIDVIDADSNLNLLSAEMSVKDFDVAITGLGERHIQSCNLILRGLKDQDDSAIPTEQACVQASIDALQEAWDYAKAQRDLTQYDILVFLSDKQQELRGELHKLRMAELKSPPII